MAKKKDELGSARWFAPDDLNPWGIDHCHANGARTRGLGRKPILPLLILGRIYLHAIII